SFFCGTSRAANTPSTDVKSPVDYALFYSCQIVAR
ncbi:MAG: hypothetical protein ACI9W1_000715, partial [Candidatus Azotimanducaceae bacterium]